MCGGRGRDWVGTCLAARCAIPVCQIPRGRAPIGRPGSHTSETMSVVSVGCLRGTKNVPEVTVLSAWCCAEMQPRSLLRYGGAHTAQP